jgi:hypothetical protein
VTNRNVLLGIAMQSLANASSSSSSEEAIRSALSLSHLLQFSEILEFLFESGVFDELMCVCRAVVKSNTAVQLACAKLMKVLLHSIKVKFFFFFLFLCFFSNFLQSLIALKRTRNLLLPLTRLSRFLLLRFLLQFLPF